MGKVEADETALWLELLREKCGMDYSKRTPLETEACELVAIFTTMINCTRYESEARRHPGARDF